MLIKIEISNINFQFNVGKLYKCFKNFSVNTFDNIKVVLSIVKTWLSRNINISLGCSLDSLPTKNCVSPFKQAIFEVWCDWGGWGGGWGAVRIFPA